jgi:WD40 repeat protein
VLPAKAIVCMSFNPDGTSIRTLEAHGRVSEWSGADFQHASPLLDLGEHIHSSCFSRDGRFIAVNWTNGVIQVWDVGRRALAHRLTNEVGSVHLQRFLPDEKSLITWSERDNMEHELALASGLEQQTWRASEELSGLAMSPDGRSYLTTGHEGEVVLRDLLQRNSLNLGLSVVEPEGASYSPDGKLLAIACASGQARVWDAVNWQPVANLGAFLKGAHTAAFSPDGHRLAIAGGDVEAVKLWDTVSWQHVLTLSGDGSAHLDTQFSPDGHTILWANRSGVLHFWRAPSFAQIDAVEAKEKENRP